MEEEVKKYFDSSKTYLDFSQKCVSDEVNILEILFNKIKLIEQRIEDLHPEDDLK